VALSSWREEVDQRHSANAVDPVMNTSGFRVLASVGLSSPNLIHDLRVLINSASHTGFPDEREKEALALFGDA
jgi:hypothetical protein